MSKCLGENIQIEVTLLKPRWPIIVNEWDFIKKGIYPNSLAPNCIGFLYIQKSCHFLYWNIIPCIIPTADSIWPTCKLAHIQHSFIRLSTTKFLPTLVLVCGYFISVLFISWKSYLLDCFHSLMKRSILFNIVQNPLIQPSISQPYEVLHCSYYTSISNISLYVWFSAQK